MESDVNKVNRGIGGIGAKPKKQNSQTQARRRAKEKQQAEPPKAKPLTNEMIFRKIFGPETIKRDWSMVNGMIGDVLNQEKDYCWAIVFARLMQAFYNKGLRSNLHNEFFFLELVDHIKDSGTESFALANLKTSIDHIATHGILKKPLRQSNEKASSKGLRIKQRFHLYEDVDASFMREKVEKYPIGLVLEFTLGLIKVGQGIYYLPKKQVPTLNTNFHSMVIMGHGITTQNSWGTEWGCKGYIRIIIEHECDIFCVEE